MKLDEDKLTDRTIKGFFVIWVVGAILTLAFWGLVAAAIIKVVWG